MSDEKAKKEECCKDEGCGSGGGCGSGCGCACKVLVALVLLLLGGIIGYLAGTRCHPGMKSPMCPMMAPAAPVTPQK